MIYIKVNKKRSNKKEVQKFLKWRDEKLNAKKKKEESKALNISSCRTTYTP